MNSQESNLRKYRREGSVIYTLVEDPSVGSIPMCHEELVCICKNEEVAQNLLAILLLADKRNGGEA